MVRTTEYGDLKINLDWIEDSTNMVTEDHFLPNPYDDASSDMAAIKNTSIWQSLSHSLIYGT